MVACAPPVALRKQSCETRCNLSTTKQQGREVSDYLYAHCVLALYGCVALRISQVRIELNLVPRYAAVLTGSSSSSSVRLRALERSRRGQLSLGVSPAFTILLHVYHFERLQKSLVVDHFRSAAAVAPRRVRNQRFKLQNHAFV